MFDNPHDSMFSDWRIMIAYAALVILYCVVLRLLLDCLNELMAKRRTQRQAIDYDIHIESIAVEKAEEAMKPMDIYGKTVAVLRIFLLLISMIVLFIILVVKFNAILAFAIFALVGLLLWGMEKIRRRIGKMHQLDFLFETLTRAGGNVITGLFLLVALVLVSFGLIVIS